MTTIERKKLEQVFEALTYCEALNKDVEQQKMQAITAIKEALAQPAQEPSKFGSPELQAAILGKLYKNHPEIFQRPQRPWVGLTEKEEDAAFEQSMVVRPKDASNKETRRLYAKAIEQALKEKNFD